MIKIIQKGIQQFIFKNEIVCPVLLFFVGTEKFLIK